ncbi:MULTISPECIES: VOC family protein [unclassified Nocardia]|uniref:VOC family protein n=1 Tax=unclassified Nocardia TaxID=2637762 RepID=UPI001CE40F91|nr:MULTISPECIES: VOC family protein [unclassified Nocardia]
MRFGGMTLMTENVQTKAQFYKDAFKLVTVFADPDGTFVVLGGGNGAAPQPGPSLSIEHWRKIADYAPPSPPGGFRILLENENVVDAYARALAAGATSALAPTRRPWGQEVAIVRDPDGVIVEIGEPLTI